jgi:hypothetical protein
LDAIVVWRVIVTVSGEDSEVIIRLVLYQRIIPPIPEVISANAQRKMAVLHIPNQDRLEGDLMGTRDVLGVLLLDILVENGAIVPSVRFG